MDISFQIILLVFFLIYFFALFFWKGMRVSHFYQAMNCLQNLLFKIYLYRNYEKNFFYYEKKIHQYNLQALIALSWNRKIKLERIFEVMQSLGQLRYRLQEPGTLEMLENELQNVNKTLSKCLLSRKNSLSAFYESIKALETNFQGTIQVSSTNPWAMLVFIEDLYHLYDELKNV